MKTSKRTHTSTTAKPAKSAPIRTPETAAPASAVAAHAASADAFLPTKTTSSARRAQALEVITRLLIWIAEADGTRNRGIRATIALYCVRPDLIGGATLEQIGDAADISKQGAHKLAHEFRLGMGLVAS